MAPQTKNFNCHWRKFHRRSSPTHRTSHRIQTGLHGLRTSQSFLFVFRKSSCSCSSDVFSQFLTTCKWKLFDWLIESVVTETVRANSFARILLKEFPETLSGDSVSIPQTSTSAFGNSRLCRVVAPSVWPSPLKILAPPLPVYRLLHRVLMFFSNNNIAT